MAQRFSKVDIGEDIELFFSGYISYEELCENDDFIDAIAECPVNERIRVVLTHCQYLDFPDTMEDMPEDDLNDLIDIYDDLLEDGHIYFDKYLDVNIEPLEEDILSGEIVEY